MVALNIMNSIGHLSYSFAANAIFVVLTLYLYVMFNSDISNDYFSPWKIFVYSFFAFYVFQIFSTQFSEPVFLDYPYEYKTTEMLLKSANLFMLGSIMYFFGYKRTSKIKVSSFLLNYSIYSLNNRQKLILYNYIIFIIALIADFYNSYINMGTIFGRITTNYSSVSLGSLSLLLYLYPIFLTNTVYIFLKYKIGFINRFLLINMSILVIIMQLFSGTRSFLFGFAIASMYLYKYKFNRTTYNMKVNKLKQKLKNLKFLVLLILIYTINVILQLYRQNKDLLNLFSKFKIADFMWKYDTIETYLIIVRQFPNIEPYKYFYSIKNLLVWIIPRSMYDDKSIAFGKYLAYLIWPSFDNVPSAYAGITIGEFYANFGVLGMMISLLIIGFISGLINQALGDNKNLDACTLLYSYIVIGLYGFYRGDFTTKTVHMILPFIFMFIIISLTSVLFSSKNRQ